MAESFIVPQDGVVSLTGNLETPGSLVLARCKITLTSGDPGVIYTAHSTISSRTFEVPFSAEHVFFGAATEATVNYAENGSQTVNVSPSAVLSTTTYINDTVTIIGVGVDGSEEAGTWNVLILGRLLPYAAGS